MTTGGATASALSDHADEIARAFGLGSRAVEFGIGGRGEQGQVWRLVTDGGTFAVKELWFRQEEGDALVGADFQEASRRAGVPVPRPLRTGAGRLLAEIGPHQVRAYEWVDLLPADRALDPALVGATVAAIHRVQHAPARPLHPWYTDPVGAERWAQLHREAVSVGAPFAEQLAAEIPSLLELEALLEPPATLQNCHRDLWSDNILPVPGGGVCVIDWESCGLADPAQELPMVLLDFAADSPTRMRDLFAAYQEAGGPARLRSRASFTMVIAQFGHFWESAVARYAAPGASSAERAHSVERVEELMAEPLRVRHVDAILETLADLA